MRLLRKTIRLIFILVIVLCVAAYALVRSDTFVVSYLLPFVSKQLGTPLSAQHAQIDPFTGISLKDLRYDCEGSAADCRPEAPFSLHIPTLDLTYDFWQLFSGKLHITSLKADGVRVGILSGDAPQEADPPPSAGETLTPTPTPTPTPESGSKPLFTIALSDGAITNARVHFHSAQGAERYHGEEISLKVPQAESHGDSTIELKTVVTIQGAGVPLEKEKLSAVVTLKEATFFQPKAIDIDLSAGSSVPAPLEIDGELIFESEPYALKKIVLTKAILRESLAKAVGVSVGPIKEFEYEIDGHYELGVPSNAAIRLALNKHLFLGEGAYDLKGSRLETRLAIHADRVQASSGKIDLFANHASLLKGSFAANASFDPYSKTSSFTATFGSADFDLIDALRESLTPKSVPEAAAHGDGAAQGNGATQESPNESSATPDAGAAAAPIPDLPLLDVAVTVEKSVYQKIPISGLSVRLKTPSTREVSHLEVKAGFDAGGAFSMSGSGSLDHTFKLKVTANNVNILPFAALVQDDGALLEGTLNSYDLDVSASPKDPRTTITGHMNTRLSNFTVPSTLQQQVPFNILFLPLDVLITVFGGTLNAMLPSSVSSISDSLKSTIDEAGRLGLKRGSVDLVFDNGDINFKNVDFDTKNLPDFTFKGKIKHDDGLDLTIFIALLKPNLPLPVVGSLALPLPDVVYLGPEIIRGLGLSIGNLAGGSSDEPPTPDAEPAEAPPASSEGAKR